MWHFLQDLHFPPPASTQRSLEGRKEVARLTMMTTGYLEALAMMMVRDTIYISNALQTQMWQNSHRGTVHDFSMLPEADCFGAIQMKSQRSAASRPNQSSETMTPLPQASKSLSTAQSNSGHQYRSRRSCRKRPRLPLPRPLLPNLHPPRAF